MIDAIKSGPKIVFQIPKIVVGSAKTIANTVKVITSPIRYCCNSSKGWITSRSQNNIMSINVQEIELT